MRRAHLSIVLTGILLLAGCATGPGSPEAVPETLDAPGVVRGSQTPPLVSGAQRETGASVTYEVGDGQDDERATDQGLLWSGTGGRRPGSSADWPLDSGFESGVLYAMAYFPSPSGVETERANSLGELYGDARPGYGLYTFVLGGPVGASSAANADAYDELLRVIETYVLNNPEGSSDSGGRHGFLIQVDAAKRPDEAPLELVDRTQPGISLQIQSVLARQLRVLGQVELADRLEHSDGPFLVTSLQPSLIPRSEPMPLLIVDLHDLGPEYMYPLIDAYDRPIPPDLLGRPQSLSAIGRRIQAMFPNRRIDSGAAPPPSGEWIWLTGVPGRSNALAAAPTLEES